ncbi:MAG: ArsA family ATPase [Actinomycetota bacterium]|nr:ArsA family ATPase [Actinomycetota bacterium]
MTTTRPGTRSATDASAKAPAGRARKAGTSPVLDLASVIADPGTRIIVCCGAGGVGKTTTSAALALAAAEIGRQVVVMTIDPARRLAQSLGLEHLENTPRDVPAAAQFTAASGGHLQAMMLDMKRTFDEIVEEHSEPARARQILENPFYQALSSSFAGTQEYMAMEKLGQLRETGKWDLIVVDTPPSRSALDFLDAPHRMSRFLDGTMIRLLSAPARAGGRAYLRMVGAGLAIFGRIITKILGGQLLRDVSHFVGALDTMFGGFRQRAQATYDLLRQPGTAFLVVAAPEPDALREASYFVDRLSRDRMPLAGLVLNRVHPSTAPNLSASRAEGAAEGLTSGGSRADLLAASLLQIHANRVRTDAHEQRLARRFASAHPNVAVRAVPAAATDVHDLDDLREIGRHLTAAVPGRPRVKASTSRAPARRIA